MADQDPQNAEVAELRARIAELEAEAALNAAAARAGHRRSLQLEAIIETVPVGVILADEKGQIFHGNSRVEEIVRHPVLKSEDVDSYGEWISFHEDGRRVESHEYPLSRVLKDGEEHSELDVNYQRGDGTLVWLRIIGRPIRDDDGSVIGASVAVIDIDETRRLQDRQKILIAELNHRVKNAFAVVKSIVSQSLRSVKAPTELRQTIDARLDAYSRAHAKLVGEDWSNADLMEVAGDIVAEIGSDQVEIDGPHVDLPSRMALTLSMALYELATNALKYGALSVPEGRVRLVWQVEDDPATKTPEIVIEWMEHGGPEAVEPTSKGFGTFITQRAVALETQGSVETNYNATGFAWRLRFPLEEALVERT